MDSGPRIRSLVALGLFQTALLFPLLIGPRLPPRPPTTESHSNSASDDLTEPAADSDDTLDSLPVRAVARLGTARFRHTDRVKVAAVSPDGKVLATAAGARAVHLWDATTGRRLRDVETDSWGSRALSFSPDATLLATAGDTVSLWEVATGRLVARVRDMDHESYLALAFSPDGRVLAVGTGGHVIDGTPGPSSVLLLDAPTGRKVRRMDHADMVEGVAFSPDGATVASASRDRTVRLWDVRTGQELRRFGAGDVPQTRVAFSSDGKWLASGDWDGRVTVRDAGGAQRWQTTGHRMPVGSLAFSPDASSLLAGAEYGTVRVYDAATGAERVGVGGVASVAWFGAFAPDGKGLALWGYDNAIHLWDLANRRERRPAAGHTGAVLAVAVSPDARTVASAGFDGVRLWDVSSGREVRRLGGPSSGWSVAFSLDGRSVAAGGTDGKARVWDAGTGRRVWEVDVADAWVSEVAFSPDGRLMFTAGTFVVQVWDLRTGRQVGQFGMRPAPDTEYRRPVPPLSDLVVSPDGKSVAVCARGEVRVWDVATGLETRPAVGGGRLCGPLAFSPDGQVLACGWAAGQWEEGVSFWDVAAGRERSRMKLGRRGCSSLAFAPDGRSIAGACEDGIRVWGVPGWQELAHFRGHDGWASRVAFSPDGKYLASGSCDTTVLVWELERIGNR